MEFPRLEYWSGLPFLSPRDLPDPGIGLTCPALPGRFFATEAPGKTQIYSNQLTKCPESNKESYKGKEEMLPR